MPKRSDFAAKRVATDQIARSFDITTDYYEDEPIRGITEIKKLLELTMRHNSFISGGYARYCMSPAHNPIKPVDLDIFSSDMQNHKNIIAHFEQKYRFWNPRFKEDVLGRAEQEDDDRDDEDKWLKGKTETEFAVSYALSHRDYPEFGAIDKIQFIKPSSKRTTAGPLMDILNNFDFTICKVAILSPTVGVCHMGMREDEQARLLRILGEIPNPIATFARITKYCKKGYNLSPMTLIKVLNAWRDADDNRQLESLEDVAAYQLHNMEHSSEIDKEIDFYELRQISNQVDLLRTKLPKNDPRSKRESFWQMFKDKDAPAKIASSTPGSVYEDAHTSNTEPKTRTMDLDKEGELLLQAADRMNGWDF